MWKSYKEPLDVYNKTYLIMQVLALICNIIGYQKCDIKVQQLTLNLVI